MSRATLGLAVWLLIGGSETASGQVRRDLEVEPPPKLLGPKPADDPHYRALKAFLRGKQAENDSRFLDALHLYQDALKLDPKARPVYKALIPLCFSLDRDQQALDHCRAALALDPNDLDLLVLYARELQERGRLSEAAEALEKAVRLPAVSDRPEQLAQVCLDLGKLLEEQKHYARAARAYEQAVRVLDQSELLSALAPAAQKQINAELARTYERLGQMELLNRQFDKAVKAFSRAQEKDPLRADRLHYHLAEVHLARRDPERALGHLHQYLASQPAGLEGYELLIGTLTTLRRDHEILPSLERAAKQDAFNQPLKLLLARQYVQTGRLKEAEALYEACWKDNPTEDVYRVLARLYVRTNRSAELLRMLDESLADVQRVALVRPQLQVLATDVELVKALATAKPASGAPLAFKTRRVLATLCRQAKLYDAAEQFCRQCLAEDPEPGETYLELCRVLSSAKKWDAEAAVCREALTKQLKTPAALFQLELARALSLAGKDAEAVAEARKAVEQSGTNADDLFRARYTLATVFYRCGKLDQARAECDQLLQQAGDLREKRQVHYLLSGIHGARKDHAKAEEHLKKLLDIDPEDATACNDLGYLWADQGKNLEEAERLIRKAIDRDRAERASRRGEAPLPEADKDHAAFIDSLGWVLYKRGQITEARKQLEYASGLADGDDPVIWDHLGEVYERTGQLEKALAAWQKALRLYETTRRVGHEDRRDELRAKLQRQSRKR